MLLQSEAPSLDDRIYEPYGVRDEGRISLSGCHPNPGAGQGLKATNRAAYQLLKAIVVLNACFVAPAAEPARASRTEWTTITRVLSRTNSAAGSSILDRVRACRIRIQRDASWAEPAYSALAAFKANRGDLVIRIVIDLPPQSREDPPSFYRDLIATWVVSGGKVRPEGGWAELLQRKPPPIGSPSCMNC